MASLPKISVVMPAFNAGQFVEAAVESILAQSFGDFEFIIVNDGSVDRTAAILNRYASLDDRVRLVHQGNQGMIAALNRGCSMARGDYIARMDADDISYPQRLAKQLSYMECHPDIGILGTWIRKIRDGVAEDAWCPPTDPGVLRWELFFGVNVAHPSTMIRTGVAEQLGYYRASALHVEDVDLWFRASAVTEFANLPEILYDYRVGHGGTSQIDRPIRRQTHVRFLREFICRDFHIDAPQEAVEGLRQTRVGPGFRDLRQIRLTASLLRTLHDRFLMKNQLSAQERGEISRDAARRVARLAVDAAHFSSVEFLRLSVRALRLDYRLLSSSSVKRGFERVLQP